MDVEQQQGTWTQLSLFEWAEGSVRPGASGEGGIGPAVYEEWQASTALNRELALTSDLMERICERGNLNRAYKRVKADGPRLRRHVREGTVTGLCPIPGLAAA